MDKRKGGVRGGFRQGPRLSGAPGKVTLPRWTLNSPPPPLDSSLFLLTRLRPLSSQGREVPRAPSADLPASASLTLGFDVIHHGARGFHDHVARPGAPSGVVHSPQGEPGREQRVWSSERARGPADGPALPGQGRLPTAALVTLRCTYAVWSLTRLPGVLGRNRLSWAQCLTGSFVAQSTGSQSGVPRPAASASPGNLTAMKMLMRCPDLPNHGL